jgi:hypothetical protein
VDLQLHGGPARRGCTRTAESMVEIRRGRELRWRDGGEEAEGEANWGVEQGRQRRSDGTESQLGKVRCFYLTLLWWATGPAGPDLRASPARRILSWAIRARSARTGGQAAHAPAGRPKRIARLIRSIHSPNLANGCVSVEDVRIALVSAHRSLDPVCKCHITLVN